MKRSHFRKNYVVGIFKDYNSVENKEKRHDRPLRCLRSRRRGLAINRVSAMEDAGLRRGSSLGIVSKGESSMGSL